MKKKLNKIFDEATPNELEQFSDALGAAEASDEELAAIKSKVYARLEIKKKKRAPAKIWLRAGIVAACVAVVMSFEPHPSHVLPNLQPVPTIYGMEERIRISTPWRLRWRRAILCWMMCRYGLAAAFLRSIRTMDFS